MTKNPDLLPHILFPSGRRAASEAYADDSFFALLFETPFERFNRCSPNNLPAEFTLALEQLAIPAGDAAARKILSVDYSVKKPSSNGRESGGKSSTILQRVALSDKTAVEDCLKAYGDFVWASAKKFTESGEEAEIFAREIFLDIWKNAARYDPHKCGELDFIRSLILRHILRQERKPNLSAAFAK